MGPHPAAGYYPEDYHGATVNNYRSSLGGPARPRAPALLPRARAGGPGFLREPESVLSRGHPLLPQVNLDVLHLLLRTLGHPEALPWQASVVPSGKPAYYRMLARCVNRDDGGGSPSRLRRTWTSWASGRSPTGQ
jgi:hypothetical protein